jgi:mRNA interferase YafQ
MKAVFQTSQFRKDVKRAGKRGKDLMKLMEVIRLISNGSPLPEKHRDHPLSGNWSGSRDCHVEPDWLLIYRVDEECLFLERTGTHSDLFR